MLASCVSTTLAESSVHVMVLVVHALVDIPLETLIVEELAS